MTPALSVIYQELNLVPYISVAENIFLGREPRRPGGLIDWQTMNRDVEKLLEPFKLSLNPRGRVSSIGPAYQQVVEIAKALSLKADIIVMDEPTAPLTGSEVDRLFEIIRSLKAGGVSIAYISHRLEELHEVADRVTVLRDGRRMITAPLASLTVDDIIRNMVGRQLTEQYLKAGPRLRRRSFGWRALPGGGSARTFPSPFTGGRSSGSPASSGRGARRSCSSSTGTAKRMPGGSSSRERK